MAHAVNTQILERREVRRWKKALKAEPGLMLCGKRILQHCDRLAILLLLNVFPIACYATYLSFWDDTVSFFMPRSANIISSSSNKDTSISQTEWTSCLGVAKGDNLLNFS